jgi:hypothetical protein
MYSAAEADYGADFTPRDLHRYLIDFRGINNKDDVLHEIKAWMDKYNFPPGEWLYFQSAVGLTGGEEAGDKNAKILFNDMNRYELDKVTPNNPRDSFTRHPGLQRYPGEFQSDRYYLGQICRLPQAQRALLDRQVGTVPRAISNRPRLDWRSITATTALPR